MYVGSSRPSVASLYCPTTNLEASPGGWHSSAVRRQTCTTSAKKAWGGELTLSLPTHPSNAAGSLCRIFGLRDVSARREKFGLRWLARQGRRDAAGRLLGRVA